MEKKQKRPKELLAAKVDASVSMWIRLLTATGISPNDILAAGVHALLLASAKQSKIGGKLRTMVLNMEQQGTLAHQMLFERLDDSDGGLKLAPKPLEPKKARGRPKRTKPIDPVAAYVKAKLAA